VNDLVVEPNYFGEDAVARHNLYMDAKQTMSEGTSKLWAKTFQEVVPYLDLVTGDVHDYQWGFELPPIKLGLQAKPRPDDAPLPEKVTRWKNELH